MKKINLTFKKICLYLVLMGFAGICYLGASNIYVELVSKDLTSSEVKEVPYHRVGIVLGTNPISRFTGRRNPFYDYRIEAATRLYKAGKIERILVSGDNGKKTYSEPDIMKEELVKAVAASASGSPKTGPYRLYRFRWRGFCDSESYQKRYRWKISVTCLYSGCLRKRKTESDPWKRGKARRGGNAT